LKINWWRVAAFTLFISTLINLIVAIFLDGNTGIWTCMSLTSYTLVRLEWLISGLVIASRHEQEEPYGQ